MEETKASLAQTVRVFKLKWFAHFARKERIDDKALLDAVTRAGKGSLDADLGGGVIKQRIARRGEGKSGGYRTIIFFKRGHRAFFMYGFAKSERANIDARELAHYKEAAPYFLGLDETELNELLANGDLLEVKRDG